MRAHASLRSSSANEGVEVAHGLLALRITAHGVPLHLLDVGINPAANVLLVLLDDHLPDAALSAADVIRQRRRDQLAILFAHALENFVDALLRFLANISPALSWRSGHP